MTATIRPLTPDEWQTYRDVRLAALADAPEFFGGTYAASAALPDQQWIDWCDLPSWFAFDGERAIGMVRAFRSDDGRLPELVSMWVAPSSRGGDVAGRLVRSVLDWARHEGEAGVRLRVVTTNARAMRLYEREGFTPNGVTEHEPDGIVEIELEHRFDPDDD